MTQLGIRAGVVLVLLAAGAAVYFFTPLEDALRLDDFASFFEPHRHAWYALPVVIVTYTVLGLLMFPVLIMIAATGVAFGPWLGTAYAMVGCLVSGSIGFAIGRWAGPRRVETLGGDRVKKISRTLGRNGTLAIFLLRKVPAPFMLANIVAGASQVSFRDFLLGTILGMGAIVVALAGFGFQLMEALRDPSLVTLLQAAAYLSVPLTLAWFINRALRPSETA